MNTLPKLAIKDRRICLDGIRLRCVKSYSLAGRMDRGASYTELTVTMLVDSKFHVATDDDAVSGGQDAVNAFASAVNHQYLTHDMPPSPNPIKPSKRDANTPMDGITFSE